MKRLATSAFFLVFFSAFSNISFAQDLTISTNTTWQPGTYTYNNVSIINNAILTFNGAVTLNAQNLTIESGSSISADYKGYPVGQGSGKGTGYGSGGGYGGKGGSGINNYTGGSTYGSAMVPIDLGSPGNSGPYPGAGSGGGAIKLMISSILTLDGKITTNGQNSQSYGGGSGGSVYIAANEFTGSGFISANGGNGQWGGGGGGRIAVYYQTSSFAGTAQAKGGIGYDASFNGADGTVAFIDLQNNIFYPGSSFTFQESDSPFNFSQIILNNSKIISQGNVNLTVGQLSSQNSSLGLGGASTFNATSLSLENSSVLTLNDYCNVIISNPLVLNSSFLNFTGSQSLSAPSLVLDNGSALILSGKELLAVNDITLSNRSNITHILQGKIDLNLKNLTVDSTSSISADFKGYLENQGPGKGTGYGSGGGYGGKGGTGINNYPGGLTYGSSITPEELGSGGNASPYSGAGSGGGAVKLMISSTLTLDGKITANGQNSQSYGGGSGGSIYIVVAALKGVGSFEANGGNGKWGGGGGGRIAIYYQTSSFAGTAQAKGGIGTVNGEDGTVILQKPSLDSPIASFTLLEKSSSNSILSETLSSQPVTLNNVTVTGSLTGSLSFNNLEFVTITSGSFKDKGFLRGDFTATLEGVSYNAILKGMFYPQTKESKVYLKAEIEGELNGILEGELTETTPNSGIFDKLKATLKLNRLKTETTSATLTLEGTLSYQSPYVFTSNLYLYQGNYEGSSFGSYTGPLSAVLTQLRLTSENEYKGEGFSIISYNSTLGSSDAYAYNQTNSPGIISLNGLSHSPILGKLTATLDENKTPKTLSGTIERLDLGTEPMADLEVITWGVQNVSPGQTVDYLIEIRNDGLKAAENTTVIFALDPNLEYVSSTYSYFNKETNEVIMDDLHSLEPKGRRIIRVTAKAAWGLGLGTNLENETRISTISPEKDLSTIDRSSWRNDIQPGDIILEHNKNSPVWKILKSYWTHCGGVVYGTKNDSWTGGKEGYFIIEPLPEDEHHNNPGGVKATPIENWDYPIKKEVVVLRVQGLTQEQRDQVVNFWKAQMQGDRIYEDPVNSTQLDSSINSNRWYCSELIWAPYFNLHMNFNTSAWDILGVKIAPQEIYDSSFLTQVPGGYFNYKDLNINIHIIFSKVVVAHDPNELHVFPEGDIKPGDKLDYTISYENEGEGIAYGVYITDTLEEDLDDSTLIVNNNGTYDSKTRTIKWFIGELGSKQQGLSSFSINVKPDAQDKAEIINFATVYFPSVPEETRTNGTVNKITTATDTTSPVTIASPLPAANSSGWNNSDVTVTLTATDNEGGLGLSKTEYSLDNVTWADYTTPFAISTEGTNNIYYKSTDIAGNTEQPKSLELKIDKTSPTITSQLLPQPNSNNWNNSDVTVTFTATDDLSGIASVTEPQTISTEGKDQLIGGEAMDLAGNQATTSINLNIDKITPEVTIAMPQEAAEYFLNEPAIASWQSLDVLSGIASLEATTPAGQAIDTFLIGTKAFKVSSLDHAGNQKILSVAYKVIYNFGGILPPIKTDGISVFKFGSTIPVKFQLKDYQGNFITNAVVRLSIQKYSDNAPIGDTVEAISVASSTIGNLFRYDASENQYIFNFSTKSLSTGLWLLKIELDDGKKYTVFVGLK